MQVTEQRIITEQDRQRFDTEGWLAFPGLVDQELTRSLKRATDSYIDDWQQDGGRPNALGYEELARLATWPTMMGLLSQLLGPGFAMHHHHVARHEAGDGGVSWHQDYEQVPHTNRSHTMVHVFYYLDGLNGTIGDLMFVPGSHRSVICRRALRFLGHEELPGTHVVNDLEPGSVVIVHSALWHARRPQPGGEDSHRYFIDISYCQDGIRWPIGAHWMKHPEIAQRKGWFHDGWGSVLDRDRFFLTSELPASPAEYEGSIALQVGG
jgi:hypothetical protein